MTQWLLGHNVPGYSPENEPYLVDGILGATDSLIDEVLRVVDTFYETPIEIEGFDVPSAGSEYNEADLERHLRLIVGDMIGSGGASIIIGEPDKLHDLGTHYWMHRADASEIEEWSDSDN